MVKSWGKFIDKSLPIWAGVACQLQAWLLGSCVPRGWDLMHRTKLAWPWCHPSSSGNEEDKVLREH